MDEYVGDIRQRVLERMDLSREMSDEEIENLIGEEASRLMQEEPISIRERLMLEARVFNSLRKLDALQELLDDPEISEIMVNGPKHIFYEKAGRVHAWNQAFASEEKMQDVIQQIVGRHNRVVNLSNPIVDTRLADGSRVNIVLAPVSLDGSTITIRKFPEKPLDMQTLIQKGALEKYEKEIRSEHALSMLAAFGGLDIAGMAGVCIGGALYHVPVVLDGLISSVAALVAERIVPGVREFVLPSHLSKEPAAKWIAEELKLHPVIDAGLGLGEGTGAVMLFSLLDLALALYEDQTTFDTMEIAQYERYGETE